MKRYKVVKTFRKYDTTCEDCGGLIARPNGVYGWGGTFCHCEFPTEICLEEVKTGSGPGETNSNGCSAGCSHGSNRTCKLCEEVKDEKECNCLCHKDEVNFYCETCICEKDQPKEERVNSAGCSHGSGRVCQHCYKGGKLKIHTDYTNFHITEDQPLTPKDCGMRKGEAMYEFGRWLQKDFDLPYHSTFYIPDEEFDRLYQEFLKEKLTDK